ncbi:hypothetical protein P167DRAFT_176247 [Morchella conica CCBAS932]|uniref:Uncharacterized protein n=1 Tax=Morchella conica CCBAS932 TaxID=1392247 RepID=A0A3N4KS08_9PEZI|nr:hypothetical protein P167DRAFT_176247 [Morchella conica CCBAS932]
MNRSLSPFFGSILFSVSMVQVSRPRGGVAFLTFERLPSVFNRGSARQVLVCSARSSIIQAPCTVMNRNRVSWQLLSRARLFRRVLFWWLVI